MTELIAWVVSVTKLLGPFKPIFELIANVLGIMALGVAWYVKNAVKSENAAMGENVASLQLASAALNTGLTKLHDAVTQTQATLGTATADLTTRSDQSSKLK